ncbi:MAG: ABC transporter ATP-binding protein [Gammaproteobacteria bacterium]|nr:ABC transporter ATP-binding protein [Gammaproteobacteria bacterium]MCP4089847.1 ABC transporter ATP-binding protein [Gammaproteobacteria bacterium]MCP4275502.1 ABC transporter ATP-binding protein [Gammaproteobacteria bacterium]MCP4832994.1 ABC transporter ATP-binding protein [Gammaproteobacteria bacterium]MCP4928634.1 ABC transporter ATP-binding protein [Gammaproteobacteria bacterium]
MTTIDATEAGLAKGSNFTMIMRLLGFMKPFNTIMLYSLVARSIKFIGQAAVLGLAAWAVGDYITKYDPALEMSFSSFWGNMVGSAANANWSIIWGWVGWIAFAGTIVGFTSYIENYTGHYVAFKILAAFRDQFYFAMLPLAPAKTAKLQSGEAVSRVMTDCERIEPFYAHTVAPAVTAIIVPLVILAWCYTIEPSFVYVLTPFYLGTTVVLPWIVSKLGGDGVDYRRQLGEVNAFVSDSIQGVRDTVAFGYEKQRARHLFTVGAQMQEGQEKLYGADANQRALAEIFITVGILASALWGTELALEGKIEVLTELPAMIAVSIVGFYLSVGLANNYTDFRVSIYAARRLFGMMDQDPAVEDTATSTPTIQASSVSFDNVEFEYDADDKDWSRQKKVFDGFDVNIAPGKHVALVGPSGTGKSTVVNLLLRQWDVQGGSIAVGGHALQAFPLEELQKQFAVVSQRSFIFNDTIRANILMGKFDATEDEIMAAAREAGLEGFLATAADGLGTQCGERGSKISGGQRQRVAIARAVLKNAPIVLLDEATSSLDIETELSVMTALKKLTQGRTTLTIAHRLSTVVDSDEILVMLEGKIAERGSHKELVALGGWYSKMFEMQQDEIDVTLVTDN